MKNETGKYIIRHSSSIYEYIIFSLHTRILKYKHSSLYKFVYCTIRLIDQNLQKYAILQSLKEVTKKRYLYA